MTKGTERTKASYAHRIKLHTGVTKGTKGTKVPCRACADSISAGQKGQNGQKPCTEMISASTPCGLVYKAVMLRCMLIMKKAGNNQQNSVSMLRMGNSYRPDENLLTPHWRFRGPLVGKTVKIFPSKMRWKKLRYTSVQLAPTAALYTSPERIYGADGKLKNRGTCVTKRTKAMITRKRAVQPSSPQTVFNSDRSW